MGCRFWQCRSNSNRHEPIFLASLARLRASDVDPGRRPMGSRTVHEELGCDGIPRYHGPKRRRHAGDSLLRLLRLRRNGYRKVPLARQISDPRTNPRSSPSRPPCNRRWTALRPSARSLNKRREAISVFVTTLMLARLELAGVPVWHVRTADSTHPARACVRDPANHADRRN